MQRVWTDGACKGNPGPGGWAWVDEQRRWASGAEARSTNQRMEIVAAHRAMTAHDGPVTIVSDSTYVVNCFRDRWYEGWKKRDWKNSQRKPVANRELWEPFIDEYLTRRDEVEFAWVKGHSGDEMNDIADRLAVAAAAEQRDDSGDALPVLGEADAVAPVERGAATGAGAASSTAGDRDRRLPAGRLIGVFGLRPTELGGYDANPVADRVGRRLQEILAAKARMYPDLHVVSGLRLGAEALGGEAAVAERIPLVAVLPFPDPDAKWPESSRRRFRSLCDAAGAVLTLERATPDTKAKIGASLRRRDGWMARNLDEAIVVWDGQEPFTKRMLDSLRDKLGDDVWEELVET